jgi:hypothetical protein
MFVHPLLTVGCTVLSLGHPPKAVNRQSESYPYGAAGWLNDVDGAGFRLNASKEIPDHQRHQRIAFTPFSVPRCRIRS